MSKFKRLASLLLTLIMVLSIAIIASACGPKNDDDDGDDGGNTPTGPVLQSLLINTEPTKLKYVEGEVFNKEGMVVQARYSDGNRTTITDYTFMPSGPLSLTDTIITISWQGKTVQQDISVRMDGEYAASISNDFDVDGHKLLFQIEGEEYTRAAQKAWDKNVKETGKTNFASGGGFLGGSGFDNNWLEYDIMNSTGAEIKDAVVEVRLCAMNYLGENSWSNTKQEISRYFDMTIWGAPVDIDNITLYPGENSLDTAYSNWVRLVIEDVRLVPGANTLRITSKALVDSEGNEIKSSQNPNWGVIWRTASIDVIYVWQPVTNPEDAIETFNVHGLGKRDGFEVVGAQHAPKGLSYILDIVTDEPLGGQQVTVAYAANLLGTNQRTNQLAANPGHYYTARGTRPATVVNNAGNSSGKLSTEIAESETNYTYRITIPASEIVSDIYIGAITVGDYQTLPLDFFNAANLKGIADEGGKNEFNGSAVAQAGAALSVPNGGRRAYELDESATGKNFHYSYFTHMNMWQWGNEPSFRFAAHLTDGDVIAADEYYTLFFRYGNIELRLGSANSEGSAGKIDYTSASATSPVLGLNINREWNRFDIVGEYDEAELTIKVYANYQKLTLAKVATIEGVTIENGNLVHAAGYKGNVVGIGASGTTAFVRPVFNYSYAGTVSSTFAQPSSTDEMVFEAESATLSSGVTATDADSASGGKYVGGLGGADRSLKFNVTMAAAKTVTLDLVLASACDGDTIDMVNLNNFMVMTVNGEAVDLSQANLPHGSDDAGNKWVNWKHLSMTSIRLLAGDNTIEIKSIYNFANNYRVTGKDSGVDYYCPNIDVLRVYVPK